MYLIVGLGNPGKRYDWTRHNIGFETIDKLAYDHHIKVSKLKDRAYQGTGVATGCKAVLAKPITYMNLSGESVRAMMRFHELTPEQVIVIHDEIALDVGTVRLKFGGGAGGHNGLKSVIHCLGTQQFIRLRIGVGAKPPHYTLSDWVLGRFEVHQHPTLIEAMTKATDMVQYTLQHGVDKAMNQFN